VGSPDRTLDRKPSAGCLAQGHAAVRSPSQVGQSTCDAQHASPFGSGSGTRETRQPGHSGPAPVGAEPVSLRSDRRSSSHGEVVSRRNQIWPSTFSGSGNRSFSGRRTPAELLHGVHALPRWPRNAGMSQASRDTPTSSWSRATKVKRPDRPVTDEPPGPVEPGQHAATPPGSSAARGPYHRENFVAASSSGPTPLILRNQRRRQPAAGPTKPGRVVDRVSTLSGVTRCEAEPRRWRHLS
jgi:hypothetical protein